MTQSKFISIETKEDIDHFLSSTNELHDGYIISVQYEHCGHTTSGNHHSIDPNGSELKIRIMVTSINDAVVELVFSTLYEWQIKDNTSDITDTSIYFTKNGYVIWSDECSTASNFHANKSYAVAKTMKWRFV